MLHILLPFLSRQIQSDIKRKKVVGKGLRYSNLAKIGMTWHDIRFFFKIRWIFPQGYYGSGSSLLVVVLVSLV